jgi:Uma2 family endonuclease
MEVPKPLSLAEFLAREARQTTGHELIDGTIVPTPTSTKAHGRLVRRLNRVIDAAVGDACDVYLGDMTVSIAGAVRDNAPRPDIAVTCDERDRQPYDASDLTIRWPKLIVEVLSPRTAAQDQGSKLRNYFTIASMEEYLIVASRSRGGNRALPPGDARGAHSAMQEAFGVFDRDAEADRLLFIEARLGERHHDARMRVEHGAAALARNNRQIEFDRVAPQARNAPGEDRCFGT